MIEGSSIILKSDNIFTSMDENVISGYIAIKDNKIIAVEEGNDFERYITDNTQIFHLGKRVVTPGFVDTHTFFTGYAIFNIGIDMSEAKSLKECIEIVQKYEKEIDENKTIYGHGWKNSVFSGSGSKEEFDKIFKERPIIIFSENRDTCMMSSEAERKYSFSPKECYPEAYWKIMIEYLNDKEFINSEFEKYMKMMNSKGVTSVKEMGFDNYYGFTDFLEEKENNKELTLRISFMSQPVGYGINIPYGIKMREKFKGEFVKFSGYNRMTDGTIASLNGDLIKPYEDTKDLYCKKEIDYKLIEEEVLKADENGFRYSLHAQGDGAVRKVLNIYEKCKGCDGRCVNRHAITDMELTNPEDLHRMGMLGVIAEIYPQIMSLDPGYVVKEMIRRNVGSERKRYYWNRRGMIDNGVVVSCATDLPLMITDIPESIYHACGGYFPEGGEPFNKENTISIEEILKAWTIGGQYNCGFEDKLGTLEKGKLADITVLDNDIFNVQLKDMRDVKVCLTIVDGKVVYKNI